MAKAPSKKKTSKAPAKTGVETQVQRLANKRAKFASLATKRVNKAVKSIKLIGNLSSANYSYNPEDVEKIKTTLGTAVAACLARFTRSDDKEAERVVF